MKEYPQYQPVDQADNIANKQRILEIMQPMIDAPLAELTDALRAGYHADARINITHPINELSSPEAAGERFWKPLRHALPDLERRYDILAGGSYRDTDWMGCFGHYVGTFENDWLGIPATGGVVAVRYAEGHELRDGKIARSYVFIDFLDLMRQVGYWPIAPSLGREMHWLSPLTHDGVILTPQENVVSQRTHEFITRMHSSLDVQNGQPLTREIMDLIEQEDAKHFHPNFLWYGPAGIGTTRGIKGFDDYHGHPFVIAFPDRGGRDKVHFIRISDGHYAVTGGWGYLQATHTGNDFLGVPATGKHVAMRVMDFYRCDDHTICENWVPLDIPHLLLQMGVDIFGRMRHQFRQTGKLSVRSWLLRT
ncbi:MAG: ester cyclase [Anaerolineales bacterium]